MQNMKFKKEIRKDLLEGVTMLSEAVRLTLGPKGSNALIQKKHGNPLITNDGVTIAKAVEIPNNPYMNMGAMLLKEVAIKTNDGGGDGTTTSIVLAHDMMVRGVEAIDNGANPILIQRGMNKALSDVVFEIRKQSQSCAGDIEAIKDIATISSQDPSIGEYIAKAIKTIGEDGIITVSESTNSETTIEVINGYSFDRGYISPYMITNAEKMISEIDDPLILVTEREILNVMSAMPLLEKCVNEGKPLVIIAESLGSEMQATLIKNHLKGVLVSVAIQAPGFGDSRKELLEDIAIKVGAEVITKERHQLETVELSQLGRAKKVIVEKERTIIMDGHSDETKLANRLSNLHLQKNETNDTIAKEKLEERIGNLSGGIAEIRVGAHSETELKEKKLRIEDALNATKAAIQEGTVIGGGAALFHIHRELDGYQGGLLSSNERLGYSIVTESLLAPIRQICENSVIDKSVMESLVKKGLLKDMESVRAYSELGIDAMEGRVVNMRAHGIIDPAKVTRLAVQNAVSVVGTMLTTEVGIILKEEETIRV